MPPAYLLAACGVTTVEADSNGEGDMGAVDEVRYVPEGVSVPDALGDIVEDRIDRTLPGGWEINDGSFGMATIDVAAGRAEFDHNYRIESSEHDPFTIE
jgi:hypothetical protein